MSETKEFKAQVIEHLRQAEQEKRIRAQEQDGDYWSSVANGLNEAIDIVEGVDTDE